MANGDKHFDVRVTTSVDNKGTEAASAELKKLEGGAKSLVATYREAGGGLKGLTAIGKEIKEVYESADRGISGVWKVVSTVGKGVAATIVSIGLAAVGAKKALEEFASAEKGIRQMQTALAQNGQLTRETSEHYQELAEGLEKLTGQAAGRWIDVLTKLTQHGSGPSSIERDAKAVEDFAGITGDLETASIAISKALEGNYEMFSRWGIKVDESASQAEKLNKLYEELAQKGGGQLRASLDTLNGSFQMLHNAWDNFWQAIGFRISQTGLIQSALFGLGSTLGWLAKMIGGTVDPLQGMHNAMAATARATEEATLVNKKHAEGLKEIADLNDAVSASLDRQIQKQREAARQKEEEEDAKTALKLAQVDQLEAQKKISPEQASVARSSIRVQAEAAKRQRAEDLRTSEISTLQQRIEAAQTNDEEMETSARNAESEVVQQKDIESRRQKLFEKMDNVVKFWEGQFEGFEADPWNFANAELGIAKGPRTEADMARIDRKISEQIIAARKVRDDSLQEFDKSNEGAVKGSEDRARIAREAANAAHSQNAKTINDSMERMDALQAESESARRVNAIKSKTAAVEAGTDVVKATGPNTDVSQITQGILHQSGSFHSQFQNMGDAIVNALQSQSQAYRELTNRVEVLRKQLESQRNRQ